eukprot:scaffold2321_cov329-Prasinococcus_capsulatus_cf.AAC.12
MSAMRETRSSNPHGSVRRAFVSASLQQAVGDHDAKGRGGGDFDAATTGDEDSLAVTLLTRTYTTTRLRRHTRGVFSHLVRPVAAGGNWPRAQGVPLSYRSRALGSADRPLQRRPRVDATYVRQAHARLAGSLALDRPELRYRACLCVTLLLRGAPPPRTACPSARAEMPPRQRPAPHAREGNAEAAPAKRRTPRGEGAHLAAWRTARAATDSGQCTVWTEARKARLVQLLSEAEYDISLRDLAAALDVSDIAVFRQMQQPSMAEHLAVWRSARPTTGSGRSTVWTEAREARLVQLLTDADYDISQTYLAEALGVSPQSVSKQMQQPSMAEHLAAWRSARPTAGGVLPTVWTEARKARLVQLLRDAQYDVSRKDLAEALGVSPPSVSVQMRQSSMAEHYAAWRRARPSIGRDHTVWTEARKVRLVQLLRDAEYDISQTDLAAALGVSQQLVSRQMRQP